MKYKQIIQNLESQIKSYLGDKKAVIGISGGIDSAVVATLCTRALGKDRVLGVLIPYGDQDTRDAQLVADFLGLQAKEVNIKDMVDKFDFLELGKIAKGNIMARIRMVVLYAFANEFNGLVVGTGNKSELEVGYVTKYGDGGVDFEPIGSLYKTEIYELAKELGIPNKIIEKKPSAELWEGQTDEDELGLSYQELDSVLKEEINSGEVFEKVQALRKAAEHKKKLPPVFEVK